MGVLSIDPVVEQDKPNPLLIERLCETSCNAFIQPLSHRYHQYTASRFGEQSRCFDRLARRKARSDIDASKQPFVIDMAGHPAQRHDVTQCRNQSITRRAAAAQDDPAK